MESAPIDKYSSFSSVSQKRAKALRKSTKRSEDQYQSTKRALLEELEKKHGPDFMKHKNQSMDELWKKYVRNRSDAEAFLEIMYCQYPKEIQLAYVDMFTRAVNGEIQLPENYLRKQEEQATRWDVDGEIEYLRQVGKANNAVKELLLDDDKDEKKKHHSTTLGSFPL